MATERITAHRHGTPDSDPGVNIDFEGDGQPGISDSDQRNAQIAARARIQAEGRTGQEAWLSNYTFVDTSGTLYNFTTNPSATSTLSQSHFTPIRAADLLRPTPSAQGIFALRAEINGDAVGQDRHGVGSNLAVVIGADFAVTRRISIIASGSIGYRTLTAEVALPNGESGTASASGAHLEFTVGGRVYVVPNLGIDLSGVASFTFIDTSANLNNISNPNEDCSDFNECNQNAVAQGNRGLTGATVYGADGSIRHLNPLSRNEVDLGGRLGVFWRPFANRYPRENGGGSWSQNLFVRPYVGYSSRLGATDNGDVNRGHFSAGIDVGFVFGPTGRPMPHYRRASPPPPPPPPPPVVTTPPPSPAPPPPPSTSPALQYVLTSLAGNVLFANGMPTHSQMRQIRRDLASFTRGSNETVEAAANRLWRSSTTLQAVFMRDKSRSHWTSLVTLARFLTGGVTANDTSPLNQWASNDIARNNLNSALRTASIALEGSTSVPGRPQVNAQIVVNRPALMALVMHALGVPENNIIISDNPYEPNAQGVDNHLNIRPANETTRDAVNAGENTQTNHPRSTTAEQRADDDLRRRIQLRLRQPVTFDVPEGTQGPAETPDFGAAHPTALPTRAPARPVTATSAKQAANSAANAITNSTTGLLRTGRTPAATASELHTAAQRAIRAAHVVTTRFASDNSAVGAARAALRAVISHDANFTTADVTAANAELASLTAAAAH